MKYEVRRLTTDGKTWVLGETSDMSGNPFMDQWKDEPDTVQVTVHDAEGTVATAVNSDRVAAMAANLRTPAPETAPADTIDAGGDAFPGGNATDFYPGMSFRWWAAGKAMQGLLAADSQFDASHEDIAAWAVTQADSLIAELRRTEAGR